MSLANWIQQGELVLCKNCFGNNFSTFRLPASYFQSFILVTACSRSTSLPNLGRIILMQKTIMEIFVRFQSWRKSIIVDSTNLFLWVGGGTSLLKSLSSSWDFGHGIECPSPLVNLLENMGLTLRIPDLAAMGIQFEQQREDARHILYLKGVWLCSLLIKIMAK